MRLSGPLWVYKGGDLRLSGLLWVWLILYIRLSGLLRVCIPPYMCLPGTLGVYTPGIPSHPPTRYIRSVHSLSVPASLGPHGTHVDGAGENYTSCTVVKEARLCREECVRSHPENKPPSGQKGSGYDQETRYRKHMCTRTSRIFQPLQS